MNNKNTFFDVRVINFEARHQTQLPRGPLPTLQGSLVGESKIHSHSLPTLELQARHQAAHFGVGAAQGTASRMMTYFGQVSTFVEVLHQSLETILVFPTRQVES